MTLKERTIKLKEAFPDAGSMKLGRILGCSNTTVKFHTNSKYRAGQIKKNSANIKERIAKHKFILVQHLGGQCVECGYRECYAALEFHHKDPSQKIGRGVSDCLSGNFDKALEEAEKCVLLCGNCHQKQHEQENNLVTNSVQGL